jgi:tRNA A-37 threonylcarbamoyl transferase component Bud32
MQAEDQVAEWLVQWEEALAAGEPLPSVDQLSPELRPRARTGLRLLRGFAAMPYSLAHSDPVPPPDGSPNPPPDTPRYHFEEFLAQGGMGEVWRAHDKVLQRDVALKVLRQRILGGSEARARFEEEARLVGQLEHPSIVPIRDLGELPDGRPFFAMKLIQGKTLAELLEGRAATTEDLQHWMEVFEQICQAVAFAHARGLLHRDLKPSNIMLGEFGEVQVMDWGIAKALTTQPPLATAPLMQPPTSLRFETSDSQAAWTQTGQAKGTPAFMAPEQAGGEVDRIGKATDVFGLGGILCVILTGRPPVANSIQSAGNLAEAFARLDCCGADAELIDLAKACLELEPESRPADAAEVARRVKCYREQVAARQAEAERLLWIRAVGQAVPPAAEAARARLRQQAQALLCAEVASQSQRLSNGTTAEAAAARQVLEALRDLPVLAGVRSPDALAQLPEPERLAWQQVWQEIERLLQRPSPRR